MEIGGVGGGWAYRSEHGGHEAVGCLGLDKAADLEDANGEAGDDGGMFGQGVLQDVAVAVVVVEGLDDGDAAKALKSAQVALVDVGKVGVGDNDVGERLDVAQAVGEAGGQLEAAVVGRVEQTRLGQRTAEEGELAKADGTSFALDPAEEKRGRQCTVLRDLTCLLRACTMRGWRWWEREREREKKKGVVLIQRRRRPPRGSDGSGLGQKPSSITWRECMRASPA